MNNRKIIFLFYDLPMNTRKEKKKYRELRKFLASSGYYSLQESVYLKVLTSGASSFRTECRKIKAITQKDSNVKMLLIPISLFQKMVTVQGAKYDTTFLLDDLLVI